MSEQQVDDSGEISSRWGLSAVALAAVVATGVVISGIPLLPTLPGLLALYFAYRTDVLCSEGAPSTARGASRAALTAAVVTILLAAVTVVGYSTV